MMISAALNYARVEQPEFGCLPVPTFSATGYCFCYRILLSTLISATPYS
jgi:hypothetical protein